MSSVVGLEIRLLEPVAPQAPVQSGRVHSAEVTVPAKPAQPASISNRGRVVLVGQLKTRYFVPFMYLCHLRNHLHAELQL